MNTPYVFLKQGAVFRLAVIAFFSLLLGASNWSAPEDVYLVPEAQQELPNRPPRGKHEKILLILKNMESSPYQFERNSNLHSGREAAKHLRWKYRLALRRIKKVEHFIEGIATRSIASGEVYMVRVSPEEAYPLRDILYNELRRIEKLEKQKVKNSDE